MMNAKIDFHQEVQVVPNAKNRKHVGHKNFVLGISEEDGLIYGYLLLKMTEILTSNVKPVNVAIREIRAVI
ncbi:hypothetical protein [Rahnella laticis]|uniref:hypothetical protein n=1 Tax=Rahnella laticis TaxID=2787622 RepID=UPI0018A26535|nr:hypothetical protein [Rahnella laticis]MBF7995938.1 hypothetical protein [Rahnella laticis]